MTDDFKERLRNPDHNWHEAACAEAEHRIEQLEREKAVVSDLWEQQKEIALDYLADCNKAADRIEALEAALSWALIQLGSETGYNMESPIWHAYDRARAALGDTK